MTVRQKNDCYIYKSRPFDWMSKGKRICSTERRGLKTLLNFEGDHLFHGMRFYRDFDSFTSCNATLDHKWNFLLKRCYGKIMGYFVYRESLKAKEISKHPTLVLANDDSGKEVKDKGLVSGRCSLNPKAVVAKVASTKAKRCDDVAV